MPWIESHDNLGEHPKTKKLSRLLGESRITVVGRLHYLWWWALKYADDGDLSRYDDADIADGAEWEGDPSEFVSAMVDAGFIDRSGDSLRLHDWFDYAGRLIVQREKNAERKRKSRGNASDVTRPSRGHTEDGSGSHGATAPNQTVPNQTEPKDEEIASHEISATRAEAADSHEPMTNDSSSSSESDPELAQVAKVYQEEGFGQITTVVAQQLVLLRQDFGVDWVLLAMKEAVMQNKRRIRYVSAILQNWRAEGGPRMDAVRPRARDAPNPNAVGSVESGGKDPRYAAFYELYPDT